MGQTSHPQILLADQVLPYTMPTQLLKIRSQYTEHARDWATSEKILSERPSELSVIAVMGATRSGKLAFGTVKMGHNLSSCKCSQQFRHPGL